MFDESIFFFFWSCDIVTDTIKVLIAREIMLKIKEVDRRKNTQKKKIKKKICIFEKETWKKHTFIGRIDSFFPPQNILR